MMLFRMNTITEIPRHSRQVSVGIALLVFHMTEPKGHLNCRMRTLFPLLLSCWFMGPNAAAQSIEWSAPYVVAASEYGYNNLRMELDANGHPLVLHGKPGNTGGLFCTRWNGVGFDAPVAVTADAGLLINDGEGPRMAIQGDQVAVGYQIAGQWATGGKVVLSADGGVSWGEPSPIAPSAALDHFMPVPAFGEDGHPWVAMKWGSNPVLEGIQRWDPTSGAYLPAVAANGAMPGNEVCECCASMPFHHGGRDYNAVRNNDNNLRDFWLARTDENGDWSEAIDVDPTDWFFNACPESEAEYALTNENDILLVYMSAGEGNSRVYWSLVNTNEFSLTASDRIQPNSENLENHPSVSASAVGVCAAWEQNDGGYDIWTSLSESPENWADEAQMVTSELSGHSKKPVIRAHNGTLHLVYQRPSEGVIHYRVGTPVSTSVISVNTPDWSCLPTPTGWNITGLTEAAKWQLFDTLGKPLSGGISLDGTIPSAHRGMGFLHIVSGYKRRAFKTLR